MLVYAHSLYVWWYSQIVAFQPVIAKGGWLLLVAVVRHIAFRTSVVLDAVGLATSHKILA